MPEIDEEAVPERMLQNSTCRTRAQYIRPLHGLLTTVAHTTVAADCPGPETEMAGKADACAGCPNQKICAEATPKGPDPGMHH